ncbi:MAG: hypothetical protein IKR68_08770 [Lachnospiraceae bacterium]|nr:hypothetical protein [Lachnospiraceae bacterium]
MSERTENIIFRVIPEIIYRAVILALLVAAVLMSEGTGRIALAILSMGSVLIMILEFFAGKKGPFYKRLRQARLVWIVIYGLCFIAMNLYFNFFHLKKQFPLRQVTDQHIYQKEDMELKERPDALLRELIRHKKVCVPYEVREYISYNPIEDEDERGSGFEAAYYTENNYTRYFKEYSGSCSYDGDLPKVSEVAAVMAGSDTSGFSDLGIANDMLRYTFLLNREHSKETKYFWYSWYYYSFAEEENRFPRIYVNLESCDSSPELVAIWDENENLYLMGREDYAKLCKPNPEVPDEN